MPEPVLVAVAHGSADPRAAVTVENLLDRVRDRAPRVGLASLRVQSAFLGHSAPSVQGVLQGLETDRVVVLPLLLTAAYHSKTDLPTVLSQVRDTRPGLRIGYGGTLGPHPLLLRALSRRLAEAGADRDRAAVVLAAAGSTDPAANAAVARVASQLQRADGWRTVVPAYASASSPTPSAAVRALRAAGHHRVVVASYLLAPGLFADRVRRQSLDAGAVAVSAPLGDAAELADVVLNRYLAARRATAATPAMAGPVVVAA